MNNHWVGILVSFLRVYNEKIYVIPWKEHEINIVMTLNIISKKYPKMPLVCQKIRKLSKLETFGIYQASRFWSRILSNLHEICLPNKKCTVVALTTRIYGWYIFVFHFISLTPSSKAYTSHVHELGITALIFAVSDSWGLFSLWVSLSPVFQMVRVFYSAIWKRDLKKFRHDENIFHWELLPSLGPPEKHDFDGFLHFLEKLETCFGAIFLYIIELDWNIFSSTFQEGSHLMFY